MRGDRVFVAIVGVTPYRAQQLRAREHVARVLHKIQQQVELQRREVQRVAAVTYGAFGRQYFQVAIAYRGRCRCIGLCGALQVGSAQQRLDACQQLGQRKRLGQVVVRTQL